MIVRITAFLLTLLAVSACNNRRLVTSEEGVLLELPHNTFNRVSKNMPEFEYLSIKAKSSVVVKENSQNFTMILKMRKDSFIWASISGFGFEAVRALITPDSVIVLDRIERKYYQESITYLNSLLGLEVSLSQLQNILIGMPPIMDVPYRNNNHTEYHGHLKAVDGYLQSILLINSQFLISRSLTEHLATNDVLDMHYMNYNRIKGFGNIPDDVQAKVSSEGNEIVEINLHYTSVNTDKFDKLPISIPKNYEKGS